MATRRLRAFKRWMKANGVDCNDALHLIDDQNDGVSVRAFRDLKEGDVVANISKTACLTIKTSGAREIIESADLDGSLGLSVALMYERSLGEESPWAGYLQILPIQEDLPLVWSLDDLNSLLSGTELHKVVKEDHVLIYEDWKENILPLTSSLPQSVDPDSFGIKEYLAAKSLIASRSFQIDDYHGSGMVPLADLFNHKTGAEDVHITAESSNSESDTEADESDNIDAANEATDEDEPSSKSSSSPEQSLEEVPDENTDDEAKEEEEEEENSSMLQNDLSGLKMIMVKDVQAGAEVFNTYGLMGNAALLHRYGFTEPDNPYDIVNIDLELVTEWSSSSFTSRYTRARLALWRKLGYTGCESQNSEYFEVSSSGEPQTELLILLYILLLPEDTYNKLDLTISTTRASKEGRESSSSSSAYEITIGKHKFVLGQSENDILLTDGVCEALLAIVDKRESLYGSLSSLEDDIVGLKACCLPRDRRLYHSIVLRVSERKILKKLRSYIRTRVDEFSGGKRRKKMIPKS